MLWSPGAMRSPAVADPTTQVLVWVAALFILTLAGVLGLRASSVDPTTDFSPIILLVAYAPSLTALGVMGWFQGRAGLRKLFASVGKRSVPVYGYGLVLALPWLLLAAAHLLYDAVSPAPRSVPFDLTGLVAGMGAVIAGSLGEELGWRGLAQPLLQKRYSVLVASVIVGVLWATWHCWTVLAPGGTEGRWPLDTFLTYLRLIPTAVIYGWLYNVSRGSLLLVMLAHAGHNVAVNTMPVPEGNYGLAACVAGLYCLVALVLIGFRGFREDGRLDGGPTRM